MNEKELSDKAKVINGVIDISIGDVYVTGDLWRDDDAYDAVVALGEVAYHVVCLLSEMTKYSTTPPRTKKQVGKEATRRLEELTNHLHWSGYGPGLHEDQRP